MIIPCNQIDFTDSAMYIASKHQQALLLNVLGGAIFGSHAASLGVRALGKPP